MQFAQPAIQQTKSKLITATLVAALCAALIAVATLTGCSNSGSPSAQTGSGSSSATSVEESAETVEQSVDPVLKLASMEPGSTEMVTIDGTEFYLLAKDGNKALIWTKDCLPAEANTDKEFVYEGYYIPHFGNTNSWETSAVRTYLNTMWLPTKPTLSKEAVETSITTRTQYNSSDFTTTQDKVFLLSEADLFGSFNDHPDEAISQDFTFSSQLPIREKMRESGCWNWLRSPYYDSSRVAVLYGDGSLRNNYADIDGNALRPALWVNL